MTQNLFCKNQKSNSKDYNDNFDRIFKTSKWLKHLMEDIPRRALQGYINGKAKQYETN